MPIPQTGPTPDGTLLRASAGQPAVPRRALGDGTEQQPLSRWRIVHLTDAPDGRLTAVFEHMAFHRAPA